MKYQLISIMISISLLSSCKNNSTTTSNNQNTHTQEQPQKRGTAKPDKSNDLELKALIAETVNKFIELEYIDSETNQSMSYNLLIPKEYDKNKQYPLVLFMADASSVNKDSKVSLTQGYGGIIWASDKEQEKHPCFILVPQYKTRTVNDQFETTYEVEMTIRLLNKVVNEYNIDKNRLYTTGQSMGGMMSMYFNIAHPDLFAASIFVGCQWDTSKMVNFSKKHFFYIIAEGDEKAPKGMADLKKVLETNGTKIGEAEWSAKLPREEQESEVQKLISKGNNINFIVFSKGSVLPETGKGNEHMNSFDYAYKLEGIRDWLFEQKK